MNGATGITGKIAVQIAKVYGAGRLLLREKRRILAEPS
jgi:NADPH:quinone reductase-like Zn-dependent oxidoreductase